jgi:hypothetical protein
VINLGIALLSLLLAVFLVVQRLIDADDPWLAHAPVDDELHGFG